ncbi:MAG: hypothetical protein NC084_01430 [Bacteroides sp.]|nr:hypothetical protein [Eubacterium sp.]MCM1417755.1 hypothetical protein [Roseburia sp.]MCM1461354.1 hypothetical protein [Bacteroides sp.]
MNRIIGVILAACLFLGAGFGASAADEADKSPAIAGLKSVRVEEVLSAEIAVLTKSVSISKALDVSEDGFLVIPSGKTLILKKGARINGSVYIENGGTLTFRAGTATIGGSIVSDGKVKIEDESYVRVGGVLYVSPRGGLSVGEKSTLKQKGIGGSIVCLGETDSDLAEIAKKPLAAVITRIDPYTGDMIWVKSTADDPDAAIPSEIVPDPSKYYTDDFPAGGSANTVTFFFENGALITAEKWGDKLDEKNYSSVAGVWIKGALAAIERDE